MASTLSPHLAVALRDAGLRWSPRPGDSFVIPQPELTSQVFTLSEMTIEAHHYPTGTVLGFNGTTEWALDSIAQEDALWLPREDQLRELLGATFVALERVALDEPEHAAPGRDLWLVRTRAHDGASASFSAPVAADAYALAVLALVERATAPVAVGG